MTSNLKYKLIVPNNYVLLSKKKFGDDKKLYFGNFIFINLVNLLYSPQN